MNITHRSVFLLCAVSLGICSGCGGRGDVSGQVKLAGEPLPNGRITFFCEGGERPVVKSEITNGAYRVQGLPVGHAKIAVETIELKSDPIPNAPAPAPLPEGYRFVPISGKYANPESSGLSFDVRRGTQQHPIDLVP